MDYWHGIMNWPVEVDWKCETCNHEHPSEPALVLFPALTWGLVHGVCRCNICHTQYTMRADGERVTRPVCMLKEDHKAPAKAGWKQWGRPLGEWTGGKWDKAFQLCEKGE